MKLSDRGREGVIAIDAERWVATVTLFTALGLAVLSVVDVVPSDKQNGAVLGVLALVVASLLLERKRRDHLRDQTDILVSQNEALVRRLGHPAADELFGSPTQDEVTLVAGAASEVWLIQETGSSLLPALRGRLSEVLRLGGTVKIILTEPSPRTQSLLGMRNSALEVGDIEARFASVWGQLSSLAKETRGHQDSLTVRFSSYPVDFTGVIVDASNAVDLKSRKSLIRIAGFGVPFEDKLAFNLDAVQSPSTAQLYVRQWERYFATAAKFVVLTGPPRTGKTTLLAELTSELADEYEGAVQASVFSVACVARENSAGDRTGFELQSPRYKSPVPIATRSADGTYEVDVASIDLLADEIGLAHAEGKIIVLDEIGPIQLKSQAFRDAVSALLDDPAATVIATAYQDGQAHGNDPLLARIYGHYRVTLLNLEVKGQKDVRAQLRDEMSTSIEGYVGAAAPGGVVT